MHYNHVLLQIYITKTLANKNSYLIANTFYTEDIVNTSEVT